MVLRLASGIVWLVTSVQQVAHVTHVVESGSQVGLPKVHETRKMGHKWDAKKSQKTHPISNDG
jgi:hypothetical protein